MGETVGSKLNDLRGNSTTSEFVTVPTSTSKQGIEHQQLQVKSEDKEVSSNGGSPAGSPTNTIIWRSTLDSLPELKQDNFDGDPIHRSDWISMLQSIIDDANITHNAKMQHLQKKSHWWSKGRNKSYGYREAGTKIWKVSHCGKSSFELPSGMDQVE